jgi:hypothetical protein
MSALRTWDDGKRCAECCNGDRCDDPTHFDRQSCPHCKGTGWALWSEAGREDYVKYLMGWGRQTEQQARESLEKLTGVQP